MTVENRRTFFIEVDCKNLTEEEVVGQIVHSFSLASYMPLKKIITLNQPEGLPEAITSESYARLAVRTESPTTPEMINRILEVVPTIKEMIEDQIRVGQRLDQLKKYIFYGKGGVTTTHGIQHTAQQCARLSETEVVRLLHAAIGMSTETGEFLEALYAHVFEGAELDMANINEELGDACWYIGIGCDTTGKSLTQCLETNIIKLFHRYPEKFTALLAENRDLLGERKILEGAVNGKIVGVVESNTITPMTGKPHTHHAVEDGNY